MGIGGSGKQSLTKLATFQAGYNLYEITLCRGYGDENIREDLKALFLKAVKRPMTFLFTDAHVVQEGFLEYINNILTVGMVFSLFPFSFHSHFSESHTDITMCVVPCQPHRFDILSPLPCVFPLF